MKRAECGTKSPIQSTFIKVRLLGMSVDIAAGHVALMLHGGPNILIQREDWTELRNFMESLEGFEFYHDEEIETGEQREGQINIQE